MDSQSISFSHSYGSDQHGLTISQMRFDSRPTLVLGINGAGKTTLLRVLSKQLRPKRIDSLPNGRIVYVPQQFLPIHGFSAREYTSYVAWLNGEQRRKAESNAEMWLDFVGLSEHSGRNCQKLSGGQQSRLQLATALNSGAEVLLMDEPSAALDPIAKAELIEIYHRIVQEGTGLWVSTHQPHEVTSPFERVLVLHAGTVRFDGSLRSFSEQATIPDADHAVRALAQAIR